MPGYGNNRRGSGYGSSYKKQGNKRGSGGYNKRGRGKQEKKSLEDKHPLLRSTIWIHESGFDNGPVMTGFVNINPEMLEALLANKDMLIDDDYGTIRLEVALWPKDDDSMSGNVRVPYNEDYDDQEDYLDELMDAAKPKKSRTAKKEEEEEEVPPKAQAKRGSTKKASFRTTTKPVEDEVDEGFDDIPF